VSHPSDGKERASAEGATQLGGALRRALERSEGLRLGAARELARAALFGRAATLPCIGRYRVLEALGAGAMGEVFAAEDPELGRKVALKILHAHVAAGTARHARLREEAKALAKLAHPNVATVYEFGESEGRAFVAMELVHGTTLREWLADRRRPLEETLDVFRQCAWGLHAAHEARIVHRDFKPDNVMISESSDDARWRARVMDFGLATAATIELSDRETTDVLADSEASALTQTVPIVGTPAYISPEQYRGSPADPKSDQWAYCVSLFEALHGARPFQADTLPELARDVISGQRGAIDRMRIPRWLRLVMERGLSIDPAQRFPNMAEMARRLDPAPRRRTRVVWITATSVSLVSAAAAAALGAIGPSADAVACDTPPQTKSPWSPQDSARIRKAFAATDLLFAEQSWERLDRILTDYTEAWEDGYRDACAATHIRHEQSTDLLDLRNVCLDARIDAATSLVANLEPVTPQTVETAVKAARALPPIADCRDRAGLLSSEVTAEERLRVRDLSAELSAAGNLRELGRYEESAARVDALVDSPRAAEAPWLQAEARLLLSYVHADSGRYQDASAVGRAAFRQGVNAHRDDVAVDAAAFLAAVEGYMLGQIDRGEDWLEHAETFLARAGDTPLQRARVLNSRGILADQKGEYETARKAHEEALALRKAAVGPEHHFVAWSLNNLAGIAFKEDKNEEAARLFKEVVELSRRALGEDHPDQLASWSNLIAALENGGRYVDARAEVEAALELADRIGRGDSFEAATLLEQLGNIDLRAEEPELAVGAFERSLSIKRARGVDRQPEFPAALSTYAVALQAARRSGDAVRVGREALALEEELSGDNGVHRYVLETNVGVVLKQAGRVDEAARLLESALARKAKRFGPDSPQLLNNLVNLAEIADARGDRETMARYLDQARPLATARGTRPDAANEYHRLRERLGD
jgi:serine/threonine protein kinase/Flp pilus assembly protein TadD